MGSYETVVSVAGFLIISWMFFGIGGAGKVFFGVNQTAPILPPEKPDAQIQSVDVREDAVSYENITFVAVENLTGKDARDKFKDNLTVATLTPGTESGYLTYNLPNLKSFNGEFTQHCGGLFQKSRVRVIASTQSTTLNESVCRQTKGSLFDNDVSTNEITFRFLPDNSNYGGVPRVYNVLSWSSDNTDFGGAGGLAGGISDFITGIGYALTWPIRLWTFFGQFPIYVKLFYGTLLSWMVVDILQVG